MQLVFRYDLQVEPPLDRTAQRAPRLFDIHAILEPNLRWIGRCYMVPMSDLQRIFSPDRRFYILLSSYEVRMSHWIESAALWETAAERELLLFGNAWWSTGQIRWYDDSSCVTAELRRYPGDVAALQIEVYPEQRSINVPAATGQVSIAFAALDEYLEDYYQQHTRPIPPRRKQR